MAELGHAARPRRDFDLDRAREIAVGLRSMDGPLMPILHAIQEEFGYIDPAVEPLVAEILNITRAEVHGVVTFYRDFRRVPESRHRVALCRAEACQAAGGDRLAAQAETALGVAFGKTTPDGAVTLEAVYCLGLCSVAPSGMIDGRIVGRLDEKRLDGLLAGVTR
jgi:formate dehydrogenase subunit gamma